MNNENIESGIIRSNEMLTLASFKKRLDVSEATLRSARRLGLKVYYVHKRAYILGQDWIDYVLTSRTSQQIKIVTGDA